MPEPRLPNVGEFVRGTGTLVKIVEPPPPPPPPAEYIFEKVSARYEMRRNGEVLTVGNSLWDFAGLSSCIEAAIAEARKWAATKGITAASEVEVVVVKETSYYRATPAREASLYDKDFLSFTLGNNCTWDVPRKREEDVWSTHSDATGKADRT
jgi:hypothetical protein